MTPSQHTPTSLQRAILNLRPSEISWISSVFGGLSEQDRPLATTFDGVESLKVVQSKCPGCAESRGIVLYFTTKVGGRREATFWPCCSKYEVKFLIGPDSFPVPLTPLPPEVEEQFIEVMTRLREKGCWTSKPTSVDELSTNKVTHAEYETLAAVLPYHKDVVLMKEYKDFPGVFLTTIQGDPILVLTSDYSYTRYAMRLEVAPPVELERVVYKRVLAKFLLLVGSDWAGFDDKTSPMTQFKSWLEARGGDDEHLGEHLAFRADVKSWYEELCADNVQEVLDELRNWLEMDVALHGPEPKVTGGDGE